MDKIVSIITPSFNRASVVTETAESILNQTYPHWEWVVVDDGSTDNSWNVLRSLAERDARIKIFQRDRDPKGACTCRNIAVEKSTGTYLIFLDTDDVLAPFCLEQRVKAMEEQPENDVVIFSMLLFKKQLNDVNLLWNVEKDEDDLMRVLKQDPVCQGTGTLWKKSTFQQVGMWREDLRIWQDIELHIRSFLWPVKFAKRLELPPDVYLRISDDSLSRVNFHDKSKVKSRVEVCLYACRSIIEKGLLEKYSKGLRSMTTEIFLGMVFQNQFLVCISFLKQIRQFNIFSDSELSVFRKFLWVHRFRLDRSTLGSKYYNQIVEFVPKVEDSVGVITADVHLQSATHLALS